MGESISAGFRLENITPILNVKDISRSLAFYVGILGFKNAEWGDDSFTCINRDNTGLYLCRDGQGASGTWIWIGFDGDISAFHQYLRSCGVVIRLTPTNFPWACEMQIEDPDGHVLRFGTEPDDKQPYAV
ncbi:MAG: VOC family protein [Terrimonas sp.]|nr:VOC family protein [Terrimonas sp.]OJY87716.1 MAG: hypothetical protein BGP13_04590 [Sphingobacteriales bacterium 40-81]